MKILESLVATPWAAAIGLMLLHSLWQAALAAAVLAVVMLASKSPRLRYATAWAAVLALVATMAATLIYLSPSATSSLNTHAPLPFPVWRRAPGVDSNSLPFGLSAIAPWLAPFWLCGVAVCYVRYAAGLASVTRLKNRGVCAPQPHWREKLQELSGRMRLSRPVELLESSLAEVPVIIGHFRPVILMPVGLLTGLPTQQIESILLHELAHVLRHDYLLNTLQNLLDGLLFYNPAAWWLSHVLRAERENCCDDLVVRITHNRHEYAKALAALEEIRWSGRQPALAAKGGSLMKRIRRLLYPTTPGLSWTPLIATGLLFTALAVSLSAWQPTPIASKQAEQGVDSPYQHWLNEDVVYIIDDAERAAFVKLTTDEERNHFIQQFWDRRNPVPDSRENQFKTEHYRRIAYANKHFSTPSGTQGWRTDRGHMYVLYGPPDEIDSHPSGQPHPWEDWGYRNAKQGNDLSAFKFVDLHGTGDFRLAPSVTK